MARILTITANPLLDFLAPEQLQAGKVTRSQGFSPMAAGKGINVARVLQRHGHQTCACFFAGGHSGAMLQDLVEADGIATLTTATAARMRVGFICAASKNLAQGSLLETGFAVSAEEGEELYQQVLPLLGQQDLVIISGSVPADSLNQLYARICIACSEAQVPCWVDSYGEAMDQALTAAMPPSLCKPNREEFAQSDNWQRVSELHISDGAKSSEIRSPDGHFTLIPPPVREVNPVGSGDCYVAGLAHARLSGMPFAEQLAYAAACGAANAARWDVAQIAAGPEIDALAKQAKVVAL